MGKENLVANEIGEEEQQNPNGSVAVGDGHDRISS